MNIVVCVKYVPDAQSDRTFTESDSTTDRVGVDGLLSELDEYAVEEALKIAQAAEGDSSVTILTVGPEQAADAIRKALRMGADKGVHVSDEAIHGSDAPATSLVLAEAIRKIGAPDLVLTGMASTDGSMSVVPAMLAERLGLPQVTFASELTVEGDTVTIRRDGDVASETVQASLPALVSVTDQINEPRYPTFKGIMAAKKKPVETWSLADLGVDAELVGLGAAWTRVESFAQRPAAQPGPDRHRRGRRRHEAGRVPRRAEVHLSQRPATEGEAPRMSEVLVLVDHVDGHVRKTTLELLTIARRLGEPSAVLRRRRPRRTPRRRSPGTARRRSTGRSAPSVTDYLVAPRRPSCWPSSSPPPRRPRC